MTLKSSLLYAFRIIFPRNAGERGIGHRSFIGAMSCIGISLIPLVCVLVISNGMIEGITGRIIGLSTQDLSVYLSRKAEEVQSFEAFTALSSRLEGVEGVVKSWPEVQGNALVSGASSRTGATIRAVPSSIFTENSSFASLLTVTEGEASFTSPKSAVIGKNISSTLDLHPGDSIRIISVSSSENGKVIPKVSVFTVAGVVSSGYQELDALWVFIPLESGFTSISASASQFMINLVTENRFEKKLIETKLNVQDELLGSAGGKAVRGAYVYSWNEINESQYENFSSTKSLLLLIMILIVLVASVNISSALIMMVMERKKEIAILKSIGASSEGITLVFLISGIACGIGGLLTGIPLGLLAAVNINELIFVFEKIVNFFAKFGYLLIDRGMDFSEIHLLDPAYYLQNIPVSIPFKDLFIIGLMTLLLSLAVSAVPAIKAGKEKPIDTLKKI